VLETDLPGGYFTVEFEAKAMLAELEAHVKPWPELDAIKKDYNRLVIYHMLTSLLFART
jgi:hypothetical protein